MSKDIVIWSPARTAIGGCGGSLQETPAAALGAHAIAASLARAALDAGGARPAILNAANEAAVAAFLAGRIGFLDIVFIVGKVLERYDPPAPASLEDVVTIDGHARMFAEQAMEVLAA